MKPLLITLSLCLILSCAHKISSDGELIHIEATITLRILPAFSKLAFFELDLETLRTALEDNKLSGKLKEMVRQSEDDDNNIFMLVELM